jgi:two-component system, sensor histidine kinase and response regulator
LILNNSGAENGIFEQILGLTDFNFHFVPDRKSALAKLKDDDTDIIFIDAGINPEESIDTCRIIKSEESRLTIPIIIILDEISRTIIDNCLESGCSDYALKPISGKELLMKTMLHIELGIKRRQSNDINHILEQNIAERTKELELSLIRLEKAKKELETLDIAKSEFLNMISHEIRTPLNGIMGSLRLIGRYHFPDEVNTYFFLLDTSVKRLERFSTDIMEASNLKLRGNKILMFSDFNPVTIIQEIIDLFSIKYADKIIQTTVKDKSNKSLIHADAKYVRKCLHAVLDNAFKFSPRRGIINVSIEKNRDGLLNISVSDEGPGFSDDSSANIYDALNNSHSHYDGNTGMGLHLAKLIVEAHSGKIRIGNIQPCGAEVKIEFPLTQKIHYQHKHKKQIPLV